MCAGTYFLVCRIYVIAILNWIIPPYGNESDPGDTDANIKDSVVLSV